MPVVRNGVFATWRSKSDDIALVQMDAAVPFTTNVRPIGLPSRSQALDSYADVILESSGFGGMANGQLATFLQFNYLIGISEQECRSIYGAEIKSSVICTRGYPDINQNTCGATSGGGLTTLDSTPVVIGITSFSADAECTEGLPQGFVRVGPHLGWIGRVTGIPIRH